MTLTSPPTTRPDHEPESNSSDGSKGWRTFKVSGPIALLLLSFLALFPLGIIVIASFIQGAPIPNAGSDFVPNLNSYADLWSHGTLDALINSLIAGVCGTALAILVGGAIAWLVARTDVPCRGLLSLAGVIPLFIPALVGAIAWSLLCAPQTGYVTLAFKSLGIGWQFNVYSVQGMVLVFALYNVPYAFIFIHNALNLMNAELEEAAAVHGADKRRIALGTTLPLVKPAIFNAALLIFVLILEDFPVPMILGFSNRVETLSSRVYILMSQSPPEINVAAALGVMLMVLTIAIVTVQHRFLRGQSFASVTGKGLKATPVKLGRWRWVGFTFVLLYLIVAVLLPIAALVVAALQRSIFTPSFGALFDISRMTLDTFSTTLSDPDLWGAVQNTIVIGVVTALLGITLCFFLAHYADRSTGWVSRLVGRLTILPAAVPGVVLGLGMLWAYTTLPIPLYGTLGAMILAFLTRFLPQGVGNMSGSIGQIHHDLEDSASVSGANRIRAATWVTVPLMRGAVFSTGVIMFILAMRELSCSIFLYTADTKVLSIYVFGLWSNGSIGPVAAISLVYSCFLLVIVIAGRKSLSSV